MGYRGPVGKRSDAKAGHRTKAELSGVTLAVVPDSVVVQPEPDSSWHPLALDLWESMGRSGQSRFYEPSDWAYAAVIMDLLSGYLSGSRHNGQMVASILSGLTSLLLTEGDRRRAGLELARASDDSKVRELEAAKAWQRKLA